MKKCLIISLCWFSGIILSAQTGVAIFVTGLDRTQESTRQIIGNELVAGIGTKTNYVATDRTMDFLNALEEEVGTSELTNIDDQTIRDLGKKIGVSMVCVANSTPFQESYYIQIRVLDIGTTKIVAMARETSSLKTLDDIVTASENLSKTIAEQLNQNKAAEEHAQYMEEQLRLQEQRQKEQEEAERRQHEEEMLKKSTEQLAKGINDLVDVIVDSKQEANTYTLVIANSQSDPYRINLDGHILGVINPYKAKSFSVPTDWYGRMQAVQTSGYLLSPTVKEFRIPRQQKQSKINIKF